MAAQQVVLSQPSAQTIRTKRTPRIECSSGFKKLFTSLCSFSDLAMFIIVEPQMQDILFWHFAINRHWLRLTSQLAALSHASGNRFLTKQMHSCCLNGPGEHRVWHAANLAKSRVTKVWLTKAQVSLPIFSSTVSISFWPNEFAWVSRWQALESLKIYFCFVGSLGRELLVKR